MIVAVVPVPTDGFPEALRLQFRLIGETPYWPPVVLAVILWPAQMLVAESEISFGAGVINSTEYP